MWQLLFKIFKFSITGTLGLLIDFGVTTILKEFYAIERYLSSFIGFTVSACIVFFLHKKWTFSNHKKKIGNQLTYFFVAAAVGCGLNLALTFMFNKIFMQEFYLSKTFATLLVAVINFWFNSTCVFRNKV